jgi:hypothetical protein
MKKKACESIFFNKLANKLRSVNHLGEHSQEQPAIDETIHYFYIYNLLCLQTKLKC